MHYAADKLAFELGELAPFLENAKNCAIHRMRQSEAVITRESLGSNRIIVLAAPCSGVSKAPPKGGFFAFTVRDGIFQREGHSQAGPALYQ